LISPEVYSLVAIITPSTPVSSSPADTPASALLVRSSPAWRVLSPTAMLSPTEASTVSASVTQVDRRLRSLIHSILATLANP
jgi:hypothetical protein